MKNETIELIENIVQVIVLFICTLLALYWAAKDKSRLWTMVMFFYGSYLLGDLYWQACLLFYDETPQVSVVSDLSWYAEYTFMFLLIKRKTDTQERIPKAQENRFRRFIPILGPVFCISFALYFMQYGEILSNTIYAAIIGMLLYTVLSGLFRTVSQKSNNHRLLYSMVIILCLLNYALWVASCFWDIDICRKTYYFFDILLSVWCLLFIPVIWREEKQ